MGKENMSKLTVDQLWDKMADIGMHGWIDNVEGEMLRKEAEKLKKGQVYLEIGVAYGKSLATVSYYAKKGVDIYGIDKLNWKDQRTKTFNELGVGGIPTFIEGESQQEALSWNKEKPIDLLFIDGNHMFYGVVFDMLSWFPLVRKGGRIMLHDYNHSSGPGVMKAVHNFIWDHPAYENYDQALSLYSFTKRY